MFKRAVFCALALVCLAEGQIVNGGGGLPCTTTALSLQFNNAGVFGCATQWTYTAATGVIAGVQKANGNAMFDLTRFTDAAETGYFFRGKNAAGSTVFSVDVDGNMVAVGVTFSSIALANTGTATLVGPTSAGSVTATFPPTTGNVLVDAAANVIPTGGSITASGTGRIQATGFNPILRRITYTAASGNSGKVDVGETSTCVGTATNGAASSTQSVTLQLATGAGAGTSTGCTDTVSTIHRSGRTSGMRFQAAGVINSTSMRMWVGMTDQSQATMIAADDPAGNRAAFRFSGVGGAADANIKCSVKDNVTQNLQASSVTDMTTYHTYEIYENIGTGKYQFYIDGVEQCGAGGLSSNIPASGTNMRWMFAGSNIDAVTHNVNFAWVYVDEDK